MFFLLAIWTVLLPAFYLSPAVAESYPQLSSALAEAKKKEALLLVDFYAPWCYSCYYMDRNVLSQPELKNLRDQVSLFKVDVDSPEGADLKRTWEVRFLPTYIALNAQGQEVGRLLGEHTRADFFKWLKDVLKNHSTLDQIQNRIGSLSSKEALPLLLKVLRLHIQRGTSPEGLVFFKNLPQNTQKKVRGSPESRRELLRLEIQAARNSKDASRCLSLAPELLAVTNLDCDLPYDTQRIQRCIQELPEEKKRDIYELQLRRLEKILETRILGNPPARCADFRTTPELAIELHRSLGNQEKASQIFSRVIEVLKKELGPDPKKDRSQADNLRFFLELGERPELEDFYTQLLSAFPEDYVYSYRFGRYLFGRGRAEEALRHLDLALSKAYGANRIKVLEWRAKALAGLGRKEEALQELERALKENSAAFPDEVATLSRLKTSWQTSVP